MRRFPHLPVLIVLALLLAGTVYVALSGTFRVYNDQGILSGPFSALLILAALKLALLALVTLDWRVWLPSRDARRAAIQLWLTKDLLQTNAAADWSEINGEFRGHKIKLNRIASNSGLRYTLKIDSQLALRVIRLEQPAKIVVGSTTPYNSGDAAFEERYAWQSAQPEQALVLLKQKEVREAFKRLASLIAERQEAPQKGGVALEAGTLTVTQLLAPWLGGGSLANPHEVLLILNDLSIIAAAAGGKTLAGAPLQTQASTPQASRADGSWVSFGCITGFWLVVWLSLTYVLGRHVSLSAGMLSFFLPPVVLTLLFIATATLQAGRDPEIQDTIRIETVDALRLHGDLAALAARLKVPA